MSPATSTSPFTGIDHQVFVVTEMAPAVEFWETSLGIALSFRATNDELGVDQVFFNLSDGTFIELLAPTKPSSPITRIIEKHGEGLYVLAMQVTELQSATATLKVNGANIQGEGTEQVFIKPALAGTPMIQLWPKDRPHRWRDDLSPPTTQEN